MIIKIGTDRFWVKASNIERWAAILKSLPEKTICSSKKDVAKEYLGYEVDQGGRIVNSDEVYGLFGFEKVNDSITIVGCNFIRKCERGYELTEGAIELVERFNRNEDWEKVLATQLLKYSIRVRTIAYAMLNGGYLLFENGYMKNLVKSFIILNDKEYYIFSNKPDETNINDLMKENQSKILGDFWRSELNIKSTDVIEFHGINKEYPSLGSMSTYLKIPMLLFNYLGWIIECENGMYALDKNKIKENAGIEVYESLVNELIEDDIEILKMIIKEYSASRGFFSIDIVGSILKTKLDSESNMKNEQWSDHFFITGINKGILKINDHEQGQPRHGRGLLGKKDYQLIKLDIRD